MQRIFEKLKNYKFQSQHVVILLAAFVVLIGLLNLFVLAQVSTVGEMGKEFPLFLILIDLALIAIIGGYLIYRVRKFVLAKKKDLFTFKFQTKIVLILSSFCIVPVFLVFLASASFFNISTKSWFSGVVEQALNESLEISSIYVDEHQEGISDDLFYMKKFAEKNTKQILLDPSQFDSSFSGQAATLSLTEAVVFVFNKQNHSTKILSKTPFSFFPSVDKFDFDSHYQPNELGYSLIFNEDDNYIRAMTEVSTMPNTYIIVGRLISDKVIRHVKNAQDAHSDYNQLKNQIKKIQAQSVFVFILIMLLIILAVTLLAVNYSSKIFLPIVDIVLATRKVSQGRYNIRIDTKNKTEEIGVLVRSFNHMVKLLGQKNSDLNLSNQIISSKKQFLETVLGNLPAATFVLDVNKNIKLFNKAGKALFPDRTLNNSDITVIFPEITKIIEKLHNSPDVSVSEKVEVKISKKTAKLYIFVSIEKSGGEINGYIVNILRIN